jgi:predicted nuclease of predicted toxin-antitoxin system
MARLLIDEDLPRSLAPTLRRAGHTADDVRDVGLRGHDDAAILDYARAHAATLVTRDKGFANTLQYPPGTHAGIIVARLPTSLPVLQVNAEILRALTELAGMILHGLLVIVEPGRTRIRHPTNLGGP